MRAVSPVCVLYREIFRGGMRIKASDSSGASTPAAAIAPSPNRKKLRRSKAVSGIDRFTASDMVTPTLPNPNTRTGLIPESL